jgi:hypothetical protein
VKLITQISSILVALLFIYTINFKSFVTIGFFANQTEIAELFCINKEEPELQCNGKCHLATEIKKIESSEDEVPFSSQTSNYNLEINTIEVSNDTKLSCCTALTKEHQTLFLSRKLCRGYSNTLSPPPKA